MIFFKNVFFSLIKKLIFFKPDKYSTKIVEDHPLKEDVTSKYIFIVEGTGFQKWAYFRCPCGCNEIIMLSLSKNRRPSWKVNVNFWGRPTIHPSVHQLAGCKSHFWVKKGDISWCLKSKHSHIDKIM